MQYTIDKMTESNWEQVRSIYLQGIATGNATFETTAPGWDDWMLKHIPECSIVARQGSQVLGWAAISQVSYRTAYRGVAEVSIYVGEQFQGIGLGSSLLNRLVELSEEHGYWTLQAVIFPENTASLILHKKADFREVGRREKIAKLNGVWRDTILLERRSKIIGHE